MICSYLISYIVFICVHVFYVCYISYIIYNVCVYFVYTCAYYVRYVEKEDVFIYENKRKCIYIYIMLCNVYILLYTYDIYLLYILYMLDIIHIHDIYNIFIYVYSVYNLRGSSAARFTHVR